MHHRARKAYATTFTVVFKYLKLYYLSKLFGQNYWDKRISSLHSASAKKVKNTLLDLKGLFIKVGQLISILSNVLPEEFREPLESLQDQMPARPFSEIKTTIEKEFKKPLNELFVDFNEKALASASIGQTHVAKLKDGTNVVVKIQHNDIDEIAKIDLGVIQNLVKLYSRFFSIKGINHMYTQVKLMIEDELDYVKEAKSMQHIKENLQSEIDVIVPKVFEKYTNHKIITSEFSDGVKISNIKQLDEWNIDRKELAERFVQLYCKMIFEDDIFHADPHPGNILVTQKGEIVLLDFGAVTSISEEMKKGLPEFFTGFANNDTVEIVKAMRKMGFVSSGKKATQFAEKIIAAGQDILKNEIQIDSFNLEGIKIDPNSNIIGKLLSAINFREISSSIEIPKDWVLLQRVLALVLGVSNTLDPTMDVAKVVKPYFKELMFDNNGGMKSFIMDTLKNQATTLLAIPNDLKIALRKINNNELEINVVQLEKQVKMTTNILQQMVFVVLTIASVYFALYFYEHHLETAFEIAKWLGIGSFVFFLRYFLWRK